MAWNIGDYVQLKSGGPGLTIKRVLGSSNNHEYLDEQIMESHGLTQGDIVVQWYDGSNKLHEGYLPSNSVREYENLT